MGQDKEGESSAATGDEPPPSQAKALEDDHALQMSRDMTLLSVNAPAVSLMVGRG